MRPIALAAACCLIFADTAYAVEIGDVVSLSSSGTSETVTAVSHRGRGVIEMKIITLEANAAEYCERYEDLHSDSPKWKECIKKNLESTPTEIAVDCRRKTIIIRGNNGGSGSYRPGAEGPLNGPWMSVANPNWIIQGRSVFKAACQRQG